MSADQPPATFTALLDCPGCGSLRERRISDDDMPRAFDCDLCGYRATYIYRLDDPPLVEWLVAWPKEVTR